MSTIQRCRFIKTVSIITKQDQDEQLVDLIVSHSGVLWKICSFAVSKFRDFYLLFSLKHIWQWKPEWNNDERNVTCVHNQHVCDSYNLLLMTNEGVYVFCWHVNMFRNISQAMYVPYQHHQTWTTNLVSIGHKNQNT